MLDFIKLIGYKTIHKRDGRLAQLEEHLDYTERVGSSNLSAPTNKTTAFMAVFLLVMGTQVRTPEKGSLTTSERRTEVRRSAAADERSEWSVAE